MFLELTLGVVAFETRQAAVLVVGYVLKLLTELLLHLLAQFDLFLVLDECQSDSFQLVLGDYLDLGNLTREQFGRLVATH